MHPLQNTITAITSAQNENNNDDDADADADDNDDGVVDVPRG